MSITNELRKWARDNTVQGEVLATLLAQHPVRGTVESLLRIADRIDAEHESEISRAAQLLADAEKDRDFNYANWQDCKQRVLQHNITIDELDSEIERLKDELAHCIALPVDADGEVIHVGDTMDRGNAHGHVIALMLSNYPKKWGGGLHWSIQLEGEQAPTALDLTFHHHHAPTVEDVLHNFICDVEEDVRDEREIIAEYAAKLQLRGDEE